MGIIASAVTNLVIAETNEILSWIMLLHGIEKPKCYTEKRVKDIFSDTRR